MLDGNRPKADIFTRVSVCIFLMAALLAMEMQAFTVGRRDISTAGTAPRCVFGADNFGFNSSSNSFVLDFESDIGIRPTMDFRPEVFPFTQRTISYIREVFKNYSPCIIFDSVADQGFGSAMQKHSGYGSLVPRHPLQESSGTSGANRLNCATSASDAGTTVIKPSTLEEKCFRICRIGSNHHPFDSEINSNDTSLRFRCWNFNFMCKDQKPLFSNSLDFGVFPSAIWQWSGIINSQNFTPKSYSLCASIEVTFPDNRHYRLFKDSQLPSVKRFGSLVSCTDCFAEGTSELRRQSLFTESCIMVFCQPIGVQFLGFEDNFRKPISRLQPRDDQSIGLFAAENFELDDSDCFHYIEHYILIKTMSNNFRRNLHSVSKLLAHFVFVVKYRHAVITEPVWMSLQYGFGLAAKRLNLVLIEVNHDKNHVHLIVEYPPKISASSVAEALKGNSSFVVRRDCKEELQSKLWGSAFWTPSFFVVSCGGAPIETLKLYVQTQTKAALKGGVSTHKI